MRARQRIEDRIGRIDAELDLGLEPSSIERVGGGSINRTLRCASRAGPVLLKLNAPDRREMLQTEAGAREVEDLLGRIEYGAIS